MGHKESEARRKKRLEKKRSRREEKVKEKHVRAQRPAHELPLKDTLVNPDWEEKRFARVIVSRTAPDGGCLLAQFVVDLDGFGLYDCMGPAALSAERYAEHVRGEKLVRIDPGAAAALVTEAVTWAGKYRFPLPKGARKALDMLPEPDRCPAEFGREGEPFLRGSESEVRARVAQSGHRMEDFDGEFLSRGEQRRRLRFVDEATMRSATRTDPLVRLERLASLADGCESAGDMARAEELHATMEELAAQCNRLPDVLRYRIEYLFRRERMEQVMAVHERIVDVTDDPVAKAHARLDFADFTRYLGDALGADDLYRKVMDEHPDLAVVRLRYARFLVQAARRDEGKEALRRFIDDMKPSDGEQALLAAAYQELHAILTEEGDAAAAKALLKEAKREKNIRLR